jgi:prepilin-type N-terminal cleavage/methylation domain-containing protein
VLSGRRGFTLIEVMVATVAMLIVGGAVQRLLQATQRLSRAQADRIQLQSSVRGAVLAVANELRELSTVDGGTGAQNDLLSIAAGEITYRAMRGTGFLCETAAPGQLRVGQRSFTGHRTPQPGRDSVLVLYAAAPIWVPLSITGVSTAGSCPGAGNPSVTLAVPVNDSIAGAAAGTPVRFYEIMQLKIYQSGGKSWLGMRSVSAGEAIQPLFGPLRPDGGFRLDYLGPAGGPAIGATGVKGIRVAVRGELESGGVEGDRGPEYSELELGTQIVLRNAWH